MDNFKKILVDIQDLIKSSNGNLINFKLQYEIEQYPNLQFY